MGSVAPTGGATPLRGSPSSSVAGPWSSDRGQHWLGEGLVPPRVADSLSRTACVVSCGGARDDEGRGPGAWRQGSPVSGVGPHPHFWVGDVWAVGVQTV